MNENNTIEDTIENFDELWLIEAPGKVVSFQKSLLRLGFKAKVYSTKGHIFSLPSKLTPLGIDTNYNEYMRFPKNEEFVKFLRSNIKNFKKIIIATDGDQEGDVIAWDIYEIVNDLNSNIFRVCLRGMDDESILESINSIKPVLKEDAIPGRTRAIIDRLIGAAFSINGVAVGRVGTAMLGIVAQKKYTTWCLNLAAPAKDGGRPWIANTDIMDPLNQDIADKLVTLNLPMLDMKSFYEHTEKPNNMGDIMIKASDKLDMSPNETMKAMQRVYEAGRLSYPRSSSRAISPLALRRIKRAMEKSGYKYDERNVVAKEKDEVHDAPYPIGDVNLSLDPNKMGHDEGIRTFIARSLIKTGQKHNKEVANSNILEKFLIDNKFDIKVAKYIANLEWHREIGPKYPDQATWIPSEIIQKRPDTVLLRAMMDLGLGRPSTWGSHIESFIKRDLVDEDFNLTTKGKMWLQASPKELIDPRIAVAIEKACEKNGNFLFENNREPWEVLAEKIINVLPNTIKEPIYKVLEQPVMLEDTVMLENNKNKKFLDSLFKEKFD